MAEKDLVDNLRTRIANKDGNIDRQADEIDELRGRLEALQEQLNNYQRFEYVPDKMDHMRLHLGNQQWIAQ